MPIQNFNKIEKATNYINTNLHHVPTKMEK